MGYFFGTCDQCGKPPKGGITISARTFLHCGNHRCQTSVIRSVKQYMQYHLVVLMTTVIAGEDGLYGPLPPDAYERNLLIRRSDRSYSLGGWLCLEHNDVMFKRKSDLTWRVPVRFRNEKGRLSDKHVDLIQLAVDNPDSWVVRKIINYVQNETLIRPKSVH